MEQSEKFESWAIVEIMGHQRYAGFVTEQTIGGCAFVRVDVPELSDPQKRFDGEPGEQVPAFSKLFGQSSIFCITPCTEDVARAAAKRFESRPVTVVDLPRQPALAPPYPDYDDDEEGIPY